jgi:ABC-type transporter Mla MlaB component
MAKRSNIVQINPPKKKGEKTAQIILSGELTIYNIEDVKDDIFSAVEKYDNIEIQGDNIKEIDLAFVQLLKAVHKTAQKEEKTITFNIKLTEENQQLFKNTDITKIIKNI